jgi:hypothetical protein
MIYTLQTKDKQEFYMISHAEDFYWVLWDFAQDVLRHHLKHNPENLTEEQLDMVGKISDKFYEIMEERDVDFEHVE